MNNEKIREYLKQFEFEALFIKELGWDRSQRPDLPLPIHSNTYTLKPLVEKRGMVVYCCGSNSQGKIPDSVTRRHIEREVAKCTHEHLIIYINTAQTEQVWQWVRREIGKPLACREHRYHKDQPGDSLIEKLRSIAFTLEEEESLTVIDITNRTRKGFDIDSVTKKFYVRFKKEHATFVAFIQNINIISDKEWYASLMLNRLMFIYLIQKKGFLNGDTDYLRNRLKMCQQQQGKDCFHSFYRYFLLKLCHEGLGKQERSPELENLLGQVPYLNGGLFEEHPLEESNPDIQIADKAFEEIFAFFNEYQWHLDDRPLQNDR